MENKDLENAFNALSDATLGMTALKENVQRLNELENEVKEKNTESKNLLEQSLINSKNIEAYTLQSKAILDEIKEIKRDFDSKLQQFEIKENSLIKIVEELKTKYLSSNSNITPVSPSIEKQTIPATNKIPIQSEYKWENKKLGSPKPSYIIKKHIGSLSNDDSAAELNLISWFDKDPIYDLRRFTPDHSKAKKGLTMSPELINELKSLLNKINIKELKEVKDYNTPFYSSDKHVILEHLGTIEHSRNTYELNIVSWNNGTPKYDFRPWIEGHEISGKGITLNKNEVINLKNILNEKF